MLNHVNVNANESDEETMDETFKIRVSCNNCYLWRKKCIKQEEKIKELQSEVERIKLNNVELSNKNNANTKTFILKNKQMNLTWINIKRN